MNRWIHPTISVLLLGGGIPLAATLQGCRHHDSSGSSAPSLTADVTFTKHIAPILFENCSACHRSGEVAPFSLLAYTEAKQRAEQIADVTQRRIMPPWLPEHGYGQFAGERRLTEEQIQLIRKWVDGGAPEGDAADLPTQPNWTTGWQLGQPDLVVEIPETYTLPADGTDVFRNYVIPAPVSRTHYVRAVEIRPMNPRVVHHVLLHVDPARSTRRLDDQDPGPGFGGMDTGESHWPEGQMPAWLPGRQPFVGRDDIAWILDPNTDLVLQLHMVPSGKPERVNTKIGFFWARQPPTRKALLVKMTRNDIDIPPGQSDYRVEDQFVLPVDVEVLCVQPHAHYLGKTMDGFAMLPDGTKKWLIRIPEWDFNWQDSYQYAQPVFLPKGTTLFMKYRFDNSADNVRNPNRSPRRVVSGWKTSDEMAELWLQLLPSKPAEFPVLKRVYDLAHRKKRLSELLARRKQLLQRRPHDPQTRTLLAMTYDDLAIAFQTEGDLARAKSHYERALQLDSTYANAHNNLGTLLFKQGQLSEARSHYERALHNKPDYFDAHYNFGLLLRNNGQLADAIHHFTQAVHSRPDDIDALRNLVRLLATASDPKLRDGEAAMRWARRAVELTDYKQASHLAMLALSCAVAGSLDEAIRWQTQAVEVASQQQKAAYHDQLQRYKAASEANAD